MAYQSLVLTNTLTFILDNAKTLKHFNSVLYPLSYTYLYTTAALCLILLIFFNSKRYNDDDCFIYQYSLPYTHILTFLFILNSSFISNLSSAIIFLLPEVYSFVFPLLLICWWQILSVLCCLKMSSFSLGMLVVFVFLHFGDIALYWGSHCYSWEVSCWPNLLVSR